MEHTVKSKRRPGATDDQPQAISVESSAAAPLPGADETDGKGPSKLHARDGLADHQRNPLAPPINITSNS